MKKLIALIAAALILTTAAAVFAQDEGAGAPDPAAKKPELTEEQQQATGDLFSMFAERHKHRYTPVVKDLQFGAAKQGSPIPVTLTAAFETDEPIDTIVAAAVFYRFDGDKLLQGPVDLSPAGDNVFRGEIPAQAKTGKLYVIPWVKDSYGNVGTEIVCAVTNWPPFEDPCMSPGAVDSDPVDDPAALVEDDYDVWEFQIGMDDKYIYFMTDVEGNVSKGTMSPTHINAYLAMMIDTEELYAFEDLSILSLGGGGDDKAKEQFKGKEDKMSLIFFAPLASSMMPGLNECFIPDFKAATSGGGGDPSSWADSTHVECKTDGSTLFSRIEKSVLSETMWKSLSVVGMIDGFIDNPQMPLPKLREILPITKATWKPRVVDVK